MTESCLAAEVIEEEDFPDWKGAKENSQPLMGEQLTEKEKKVS